MGSNRDKQRLVDSVYFTIRLNCRIILENGNYANFDSENFIFFKNFAPLPESFAPENLEGAPPKKVLAAPPAEKILEESQVLLLLFNIMLSCNTVKIF